MRRHRPGWSLVLTLVLALALLPAAPPAYAADFIVNTTNDLADLNPGDGVCDGAPRAGLQCSLRAAVQTANALGGVHAIILGGNTYNLTNAGADEDEAVTGDLDVAATITVIGQGQVATRIDGQQSDRVFDVHDGGKLILLQLTVRNGRVGGPFGGGVQVLEGGALELSQVTVANNSAKAGGGIAFSGESLVIRNSTLRENVSGTTGGGLWQDGGTALLENVRISGSSAQAGGGCLLSGGGQTTLRNVTLSTNRAEQGGGCEIGQHLVQFEGGLVERNTATEGAGGGLLNRGQLRLTGTTIARNTATTEGGGIWNDGTVTFTGAHVNNNTPNNCVGTTSCPP
jgi:CSLREA domain-containing protein